MSKRTPKEEDEKRKRKEERRARKDGKQAKKEKKHLREEETASRQISPSTTVADNIAVPEPKSKRSKKRKLEEVEDDTPTNSVKPKKHKESKKSQKEKRKSEPDTAGTSSSVVLSAEVSHNQEQTDSATKDASNGSVHSLPSTDDGLPLRKDKEVNDEKQHRFIVFIGNLPFTTTTEAVEKHFNKIGPTSIRHITEKNNPEKSRGFAFLEFDNYDRMKTCLQLYHHTEFNDGISEARKINVELTAGGGGAGVDRKTKIKGKNEKLREERKRKIQEQKVKQEVTKKPEKRKQHKPVRKSKERRSGLTGANADPVGASARVSSSTTANSDFHGIHPSRLALLGI